MIRFQVRSRPGRPGFGNVSAMLQNVRLVDILRSPLSTEARLYMLVLLHGYVVSRVCSDLPANLGAIYNRPSSDLESLNRLKVCP